MHVACYCCSIGSHIHSTGLDAQYEWTCSALNTTANQYVLPDLGGLLQDHGRVRDVRTSLLPSLFDLYIYSIPQSLNCSGIVSALRYCYRENQLGTEQLIFTLLTLNQSGLSFTINDMISVRSTPTEQICSGTLILGEYCCDTFTLGRRFPLPTTDLAFGVITSNSDSTLLTFGSRHYPQYLAEQYIQGTGSLSSLTVGNTFTVNSNSRMTRYTLRLLQFVISKLFVQPHDTQKSLFHCISHASTSTCSRAAHHFRGWAHYHRRDWTQYYRPCF